MILLPLITLVALKAEIIWVIKIYALGWKVIICRREKGNSSFPNPLCQLHCGWVAAWSFWLMFSGGGGKSLLSKITFWWLEAVNVASEWIIWESLLREKGPLGDIAKEVKVDLKMFGLLIRSPFLKLLNFIL